MARIESRALTSATGSSGSPGALSSWTRPPAIRAVTWRRVRLSRSAAWPRGRPWAWTRLPPVATTALSISRTSRRPAADVDEVAPRAEQAVVDPDGGRRRLGGVRPRRRPSSSPASTGDDGRGDLVPLDRHRAVGQAQVGRRPDGEGRPAALSRGVRRGAGRRRSLRAGASPSAARSSRSRRSAPCGRPARGGTGAGAGSGPARPGSATSRSARTVAAGSSQSASAATRSVPPLRAGLGQGVEELVGASGAPAWSGRAGAGGGGPGAAAAGASAGGSGRRRRSLLARSGRAAGAASRRISGRSFDRASAASRAAPAHPGVGRAGGGLGSGGRRRRAAGGARRARRRRRRAAAVGRGGSRLAVGVGSRPGRSRFDGERAGRPGRPGRTGPAARRRRPRRGASAASRNARVGFGDVLGQRLRGVGLVPDRLRARRSEPGLADPVGGLLPAGRVADGLAAERGVGRLEEDADPGVEVAPAPPVEPVGPVGGDEGRLAVAGGGDDRVVDPDAGAVPSNRKTGPSPARTLTCRSRSSAGTGAAGPAVVEPDRRARRRRACSRGAGRRPGPAARTPTWPPSKWQASSDHGRGPVAAAGPRVDADVERRDPRRRRVRPGRDDPGPAEEAAADGQLGVLGPDRGERLVAVARLEDELQAFERDAAAREVEQRGRGLAARRQRRGRAGGRGGPRRRP